MRPQLTTKDGAVISLTDEIYEAILLLIEKQDHEVEPVASIEELETEFAGLFAANGATLEDLHAEHIQERGREERKLEHFS